MPTVKDNLKQQLETTEEELLSAASTDAERLEEQAYWLEQALRDVTPQEILNRAHALYAKTDGARGLSPHPIRVQNIKEKQPQAARTAPNDLPITVQPGDSLWGILFHEFTSGEHLDDPHFASVFNRLPPAAQAHFVDAVESHVCILVAEERRTKEQTTMFGISDVDALRTGDVLHLASLLKDEELLLHLISKAKEIASVKEEIVQQYGKKAADWLQYHRNEPHTEVKFEEVLYGPAAAHILMELLADELQSLLYKIKQGVILSPHEEELLAESLPPYERKIRDRFTMSASEYIRIRSVVVEALLNAVPPDEKQLALITKSAVRLELLQVPEQEFYKRVRVAQLVRAYAFGKDLRNVTVRQFFRGIVENI